MAASGESSSTIISINALDALYGKTRAGCAYASYFDAIVGLLVAPDVEGKCCCEICCEGDV